MKLHTLGQVRYSLLIMPVKALSPRKELLSLQKRIFASNDRLIRGQTIMLEPGFQAYERDYRERVKTYQHKVDQDDLIQSILKSEILYVGDYHTNEQSQRTLLRILKLIRRFAPLRKIAIGFEAIQQRHQNHLESYLNGAINDSEFLKKISFEKYWFGGLWKSFKPLFDYARYHQISVYGLEGSHFEGQPLKKRDEKAAQAIVNCYLEDPKRLMIVFFGDLHVAPEHLPAQVLKKLPKSHKKLHDVILYQNSESIYWELSEKGLEHKVEIVKISLREYCILNTPPIIWQQSYLNWLDQDEISIEIDRIKEGFLKILFQIAQFLGIFISRERPELETLDVYTCSDLNFLKVLEKDGTYSRDDLKRVRRQILASESYCSPERDYVYLGNLSMNHVAEEAAHFLRFLCAGAEEKRSRTDFFYVRILHEAMGFFGSKIMNHKRKSLHEKDYQHLIDYFRTRTIPKNRELELEVALLTLLHKEMEQKKSFSFEKKIAALHDDLFFGLTHSLGYMLGDFLYYGLLEGSVKKTKIVELFSDSMREKGSALEWYRKLVRLLKKVKIPKRV